VAHGLLALLAERKYKWLEVKRPAAVGVLDLWNKPSRFKIVRT